MNNGPGSLLVVDDNEMNRDMLSRRLQRKGYSVALATGGSEALQMISDAKYDLVLLDIMMPDIDGMEVLRRVREKHSAVELPIIIASAKDRGEDVVLALELGASDYVTKPLDFPVVMARVQTQMALKRAHEEISEAHRRMKQDLQAAARIQHSLIPSRAPASDRASFGWVFRPCVELAGDILDIFQLDEHHIGLYLIDVCGHGVASALLSVTLSRVLSHMSSESLLLRRTTDQPNEIVSPAQVAATLNRRFPMDNAGQYFTFCYGVLDLRSLEFRYVCAGHPPPVYVRSDGSVQSFESSSFAIGWFPDAQYEEHVLKLSPGERLYFYSDGVVEAPTATGDEFEIDRLLHLLHVGHELKLQGSLDEVMLELENWTAGTEQNDDITMVAVEIPAAAKAGSLVRSLV